GMMMGTPNYMSPEQIEGGQVDRRSDIFAVGLVFYELLTYQKAFPGDSVRDVMNAIVQQQPPSIRGLNPALDPRLESIVERAIQKDPAARYQTLAQMAADLARARARVSVRTPSKDSAADTTVLTPPATPAGRATPRFGTDRDLALSKRRAEFIEQYLRTARAAFDAGNYSGALEACEQAAMLDPDDPRVLELIERSRETLDEQQLRNWLAEARRHLGQDDLDSAAAL